ncbi:MAG TPA: phosphatidylserine decarboxylase, partial [Alphaproteobacteria bacterium]|nr:phosphatidylserine decarboxylase [Alphaproteobacteria bacterium]
ERASIENERSAALIELENGKSLGVVQIAGLVARRIISDLKEGDSVTAGHRYGLIRFGSRLDIYLPAGVTPCVAVGQRAIGGETILADLEKSGPMVETEAI